MNIPGGIREVGDKGEECIGRDERLGIPQVYGASSSRKEQGNRESDDR